ncbi:MAG TPA: hypothetical protein VIL36_01030 [Acidimicrobiales bacterium]
MALAVFGVVALPWLTDQRRKHDVTAASSSGAPEQRPEMPDVVELICAPGSIDVPVASIRPQSDGLHLDVVNELADPTEVWVVAEESPGWSSGRFEVGTGRSSLVLAAPPGPLTVGCHTGGEDQQRQVNLVDTEGVYESPELSCPEDERRRLEEGFVVEPATSVLSAVAREALGEERIPYSDQLKADTGYEEGETTWDSPSADPVVRVVRDGDTVALVHVAGADGENGVTAGDAAGGEVSADDPASIPPTPEPPWTSVPLVEYCPAFELPAGSSDTSTGAG